jgi:hypothetical protein
MSAKKKYKVSLQKFQRGSKKDKPLPKPRAKNYDPLYDVKPQVSESTAVRNVPKQDKKVVQKAIAQKDAERKVVAQKIQANPLLTQAQKNEILMDPRKLDENINLAYEKGPDTLKAAKDYTTAERVENALRNPLVALSYAMKPGPFNMPMNYSEYERSPNYRDDVWDDNLVLKGANFASYLTPIGLALHTLDNAAYTATDIGKAIESGEFDDWKQAGLSAASTALDLVGARYIGGSGRLLNTGERATLEAMRTSNSLGLNPSINTFLGTRLMPRINSNVVRSADDLPQARLLPQINPNSVNYDPLARSIYNKAVTAGTAQNIAQGLSESGIGARSMSLDKFPFLNQVVGTVKNKNRESSLREAEKWFKEWVDSPYTQQKIEDSYRKITSGRQLSDTERHNLEEMIKFSSRYDPTGRLQEYPLLSQSLGKSNIHSDNIGISYTHEHLPGDIKNVENTFRQKGSEEPLELVPEDHPLYGNWISRNITPEQRISTGVHELNHDWIRDFTLKNTDLGKTLAGVIDKSQVQKVKDFYKSEGKLERAEKELEYITAPTEIYARLMEARRHFNLKPGQKITNNQASDYLDAIESGSTPIDQIFGSIIDRKKAADLFNNPWAWTGAATIGAASMQEQMYGGLFNYQSGGRKPIYTNDPNDPRIEAYIDSASQYNLGETELKRFFRRYPPRSDGKIRSLKDLDRAFRENSYEPRKNRLYDTHRFSISQGPNTFKNLRKIESTFKRTGILPTDFWSNEGFMNYRFKKPVQPVYYKKADASIAKPNIYDYPPIYVSDPNDPRIGMYTEAGNQILYKKPTKSKKSTLKSKSNSKPVDKVVSTPEPVPVQTENTSPIQMPLRDKMVLPLGRSYQYEAADGSLEGGKTTYGQFEKVVDPRSGKIRYIPTGKKSDFETLFNPTFQEGGVQYALPQEAPRPTVELPEIKVSPQSLITIKERKDFKPWWNWGSIQAAGGKGRQDNFGSLGDLYRYFAGQPLKHNVLEYSQYKPTTAKDPKANYISINDPKFKQEVIDNYNRIFNEHTLLPDDKQINDDTYAVSGYSKFMKKSTKAKDHVSNAIGRYFVSKGKDEKGDYISYYDIFDRGSGSASDGVGIGETFGLTKPFEIYGRIYIDSKTGKPKFKDGGEIIKDQEGQRKYPGWITEIQGNLMATDGYGDIPLYVVPDVGEPRVIMPNTGTHEFKGATKFVEYPLINKKAPKKLSSKDFTSIKMKVEEEVEDHLNWIRENGYEEDREEIDAMKKQLWKKYMPINTKL